MTLLVVGLVFCLMTATAVNPMDPGYAEPDHHTHSAFSLIRRTDRLLNEMGENRWMLSDEDGKPQGNVEFRNAEDEVLLDVHDLESAKAAIITTDTGSTDYVVNLTFTEKGSIKFAAVTLDASVVHDAIYIYVDGELVTAPVVQTPIHDGHCVINGLASYEDAEKLAALIRGH